MPPSIKKPRSKPRSNQDNDEPEKRSLLPAHLPLLDRLSLDILLPDPRRSWAWMRKGNWERVFDQIEGVKPDWSVAYLEAFDLAVVYLLVGWWMVPQAFGDAVALCDDCRLFDGP
jgi:hypothetical protein